jgi:protoporphyrinogen/coproporphyrinogen III oxidase
VKPDTAALIIGAGISGLACAYALKKAGIDTLLLEASSEPGGIIRSQKLDGYLVERGPQSFSETPALRQLCAELAIDNKIVRAPSRAPRYVLLEGTLREVPLTPPAFLASSLFGVRTKWSMLRDALGTTHPPNSDESIADFVRRKFSAELLDKLVGPFISGIYAGDPERLSLRSAFPQLRDAEQSAGSIIRGLKKRSTATPEPRQRPTVMSFAEGNHALIQALAANLGPILRCGTGVVRIERTEVHPGEPLGWIITTAGASGEKILTAHHLILAIPADVAATLLRPIDPTFERTLTKIEYAPVAVASLGYARAQIKNPLNGFGFLIPRSQRLRTLGTVWNSSLFPGRARSDHALMTSFVGGVTDPQAASLSPQQIAQLVHQEIAPILEISGVPSFSTVETYPRAIPQYNLGHAELLAAIEQRRAGLPSLHFAGNYWQGPSVGNCIERATQIAAEIGARVPPIAD